MKYELQIFERIISGDLSPFLDGIKEPLKYNQTLREKHQQCFNFTIATFKKTKDKFSLLDKKVMSSLHPFAEKIAAAQPNLFKIADIQDIAPNAYKILKMKKLNIVSILYSQQPIKTIIILKSRVHAKRFRMLKQSITIKMIC